MEETWHVQEIILKDLLVDEDITAEKFLDICNETINRLQEDGRFPNNLIEDFKNCNNVRLYNDLLDHLYDFCDDNRIWVN